jgi:hypothetical protein
MTKTDGPTKRERIASLESELSKLKRDTRLRATKDTRSREEHLTRLATVGLLDLHALQVSGVLVTVSSPTMSQADEFFWASIDSGPAVPPTRTITIELTAPVNNRLATAIHEAVKDVVA